MHVGKRASLNISTPWTHITNPDIGKHGNHCRWFHRQTCHPSLDISPFSEVPTLSSHSFCWRKDVRRSKDLIRTTDKNNNKWAVKQFSPASATICVVLSSGRYRTCSVFPWYKMGRKCVNLQEDDEAALEVFKFPCLWMKTDPAQPNRQTQCVDPHWWLIVFSFSKWELAQLR